MQIKDGVTLAGLHPVMRPVLREAESIWKAHGRPEGVTITEARGGTHSASSFHYYGLALDLRTRYFEFDEAVLVHKALKSALPGYDIIHHEKDGKSSHIHCETGNGLAKDIGMLF